MISIIICSRNNEISNGLYSNIETTIGVEFEIVLIDNSKNNFSIFSAYNLGIEKSKFPVLCFVHEDVLFHTRNWGDTLIKYFNNIPLLGCIGVAGATYKTKAPSGWWDIRKTEWVLNIIQHCKDKVNKVESIGWINLENYKEVAVIDGVFIATQKSYNLRFDGSISGFHGYDLNLSLEAKKMGLKVVVTREILLEHFSKGTINKEWFIAAHYLHKKYSDILPISFNSRIVRKEAEVIQLERFIDQALNLGLKDITFYYWLKFIRLKPIAKLHFRILKKILQ